VDARVTLAGGATRAMAELAIRVLTAKGALAFLDVSMFGNRSLDAATGLTAGLPV
jgi:hypothetical protein